MNPALETLMLALSELEMSSRALFFGAEPHPDLPKGVEGWQPQKPKAHAWDHAGFSRMDELPDQKWPLVLILPGKSRDETLAWFSIARDHVSPGGRIVVAMPNTAGAGRFEKELSKATGNIHSIQKHKCRAFHAVNDGSWNRAIFDEWEILQHPRIIEGTDFTTQAGIFSSDHIDPGSQLLADHLPAHLHGEVADLGAGWGFLTDAALRKCRKIARIELFEADSRALACARLNLAAHDRELRYHWHDVTTGLPGTYDAIIMNPPFHSGQATDVDLGRAFLRTAIASLKRGGKLLLVANRQLPYEAVLEVSGLAWRKPAEDKTYKLLFAEKR